MIPVTFREVYSAVSGQLIGYEPANYKADEVVAYMAFDSEKAIPASRAERMMDWLEKLGLDIEILGPKQAI